MIRGEKTRRKKNKKHNNPDLLLTYHVPVILQQD